MKKSELEKEIHSLRKEVELLRAKEAEQTKAKPSAKKGAKAKKPEKIEEDVKQIITEVIAHAKKDYENLSPVTALLLFSLGALLGGALAGNKGGKS